MTPEDIKKFRLEMGLTQEQLAQQLKVTCGTLNKWENGRTKPSRLAIESMKRYVKHLNEQKEKK